MVCITWVNPVFVEWVKNDIIHNIVVGNHSQHNLWIKILFFKGWANIERWMGFWSNINRGTYGGQTYIKERKKRNIYANIKIGTFYHDLPVENFSPNEKSEADIWCQL